MRIPAVALFAIIIASSAAHAHAQLEHATPSVGSTVSSSPGQVTMHFSEKLERGFSKAQVFSASGGRVDQGTEVNGNAMTVRLKPLPPGTYDVRWQVLSVDTHKTEGSFSFTVQGR